ncbi:MAG: sugar transferase [Phycisphaerae bacterium]|jgi:lipopolysaccharide/colanic/teichoic acid biosynthesis glycosyltransferase|nr:sugar transferase [Phycisphaerae bacterium]
MRDQSGVHLVGSDPMPNGSADVAIRDLGSYGPCKFAVEWLAALVLLMLATPIMLAIAIVLKLTSPGPVHYSQIRLGRGGKPFRIWKLRTMTHRAEATTGPVWATVGDPRVTRVGRWLRDTHLDELPQLWNVLRGEMSLIGPRPERPEIAVVIARRMPEFCDRLAVRPGITGLAQVRLPPDTNLDTVRQKLTHDLHYIRTVSALLDARIAFATALHCIGAAATTLSLRVVRSSTPPGMADLPPVVAGFRMPVEIEVEAELPVMEPPLSRAA